MQTRTLNDNSKPKKLLIRKGRAERMLEAGIDTAVEWEAAQAAAFQALARGLDEALNGELRGDDREVGFVLLAFPFHNSDEAASFVSNGDPDFIGILEHQLAILKQNALRAQAQELKELKENN